ncbi:MAG: cell division protein FtsK [Alphaproteobacteria bacterium]|nr:cell division protein FtsK [Alphaproteobacteria bacterium]
MALTIGEWGAMSRWGGLITMSMLRAINTLAHAGEWLDARRQSREARNDPFNRREPVLERGAVNVAGSRQSGDDDPDGGAARQSIKPPRRVQERMAKPKSGKRADVERQPALELIPTNEYQLPALSLLSSPPASKSSRTVSDEALEQNARLLESVLEEFGVKGQISEVRPGPVVTLYELQPAPGTKTSRVIALADDIARSMSAVSARIAVVQGKNAIGIELPNSDRETVHLRELLSSAAYESTAANLILALGKDIAGAPVIVDLARMPHLLVAGTTGSGKSVGINSMILSLLYRLPPDQCKLILIDPKMLELSAYDGIPHLLTPVVTEPGKAVIALKWAVREMENRYRAMSHLGVRNVTGYNQRLAEATAKGDRIKRTVQTGFDAESGEPVFEDQELDLRPFPYVVVVVDEMADLMLVAGKEIEGAIRRLAQMARAAGIHLIMATQRPSVDVITGTIKANFPSRISFQVTSKIDSRTILDEQGAEQLLGAGDMLYQASGGRVQRVHGPYVSDREVEKVAAALKKQGSPEYLDAVTEDVEADFESVESAGGDELYDQAVALVMRERRASTSFIQRHLQIGYNRAARIIEQMEAQSIVSPADRVGKREVLLPDGGGFE